MTSQQHEYNILNSLADSVLIIESDYTIAFANQHFLDLYGMKKEEVLGKKCHEIFHQHPFPCAEKSLPEGQCVHKQVFETGLPVTSCHSHSMQDGTKRLFHISASPLHDENGDVIRIIQTMKDITEQEELREALNATHLDFEIIFKNAPYLITYLDRKMRVIKLNPLMEQLVGRKTDEVKGKHYYDVWGQYEVVEFLWTHS